MKGRRREERRVGASELWRENFFQARTRPKLCTFSHWLTHSALSRLRPDLLSASIRWPRGAHYWEEGDQATGQASGDYLNKDAATEKKT